MRLFSDAAQSIQSPYLRRAYELARRGLGRTSPNPAVGCVIIASDNSIVGEGWHEYAGGPHAEVVALSGAGYRAADSTAFVTLEPCAHFGKTPPCTEALIKAGVSRVVFGMMDPSELASGGGKALRAAGIIVTNSSNPAPFEELNEAWLKYVRTGLPWVSVKVAISLDGKIARAEGVRTAMSSAGSAEVTMTLRAASDAVLVGASTAVIDDPVLTVRDASGADQDHQPLRVVLCRSSVPSHLSLLADGRAPVAFLLPEGLAVDPPLPDAVSTLRYDPADGLESAFTALAGVGLRRILVEPGPRLFAALLEARLIDELVLIHSGGFAGVDAPGIYLGEGDGGDLELSRWFVPFESGLVDTDVVTHWRLPEYEE